MRQIISREQARGLNPLVLAFVGDGLQTLFVRARLALQPHAKSGALHLRAASVIRASSQARSAEELLPELTEEEAEIYRRARNNHTAHRAKNADVGDYHKASGLEAVIGYLYLIGEDKRLEYILNACSKER